VQFPNFNPVLIKIGPLAIRWYALAYIAGILLGWRYGHYLVRDQKLWTPKQPPLTPIQIDDLVLWITLGVIIGGRLGYVAFYGDDTFIRNPLEVFQLWHGGMSFHGGMIGVIIAILGFVFASWWGARDKTAPISVWPTAVTVFNRGLDISDLVAPCVPFGLFFGRLANFINGELWGRVTHAPWGVVFCSLNLIEQNGGDCPAGLQPRHPSQLYEAGLEGIVLFTILFIATHRLHLLPRRGANTGIFLFCYGVFRILLETVRNPDVGMPTFPLGLTMGMILSIPMVLAGAWLIWNARHAPGEAVLTPAPQPPAA
jgi:phosphatidylglycerol:prolipoprotein diacylglycerol transferase